VKRTARGLLAAVVATIAMTAALPQVAPTVAAADPSIADRVGPSIVFLETKFTSSVYIPYSDGAEWSDAVTLTASCTGYFVDTKGSIATAGHCVNNNDDDELADDMREAAVAAVAKKQGRSETWAENILTRAKSEKWQVRGIENGSRTNDIASRTVRADQPTGTGQVLTDWADVDVVGFQKFDDGDNAVLRLKDVPKNIEPLVVSAAEPKPGDPITAVGFPGAIRRTVDPDNIPQPSYIDGKVSSRQTRSSGVIGTEISADLGKGMSGGPTVDSAGRVVGTNSWKTKAADGDTASFSFLTDNLKLRDYLQQNNVQLASESSSGSGPGKLVWIVAAAAVLVLVLIGVLLLVLRGRRRAKPAPGPVGGPFPGTPYPVGGAHPPGGPAGGFGGAPFPGQPAQRPVQPGGYRAPAPQGQPFGQQAVPRPTGYPGPSPQARPGQQIQPGQQGWPGQQVQPVQPGQPQPPYPGTSGGPNGRPWR
jgi:serine protease Do